MYLVILAACAARHPAAVQYTKLEQLPAYTVGDCFIIPGDTNYYKVQALAPNGYKVFTWQCNASHICRYLPSRLILSYDDDLNFYSIQCPDEGR